MKKSYINILHLSDLHFGMTTNKLVTRKNVAERKIAIKSLLDFIANLKKSSKEWLPDILVISGDIGWKGIKKDYDEAELWLNEVVKILKIDKSHVFICAGNHDLNRKIADTIDIPENPISADECLDSKIDDYIKPFSQFNRFCERFKIIPMHVGDDEYYLMGEREINNIKFITLNSAWFCRDDNDSGKLYIGLPHLKIMKSCSQLINPSNHERDKITIAIFHHPFDFFNIHENNDYTRRTITSEYVSNHSHVILAGHTHNKTIVKPDRKYNRAWFFVCGASIYDSTYDNNFSIYKINIRERELRRMSYQFNPVQEIWEEKIDKSGYFLE